MGSYGVDAWMDCVVCGKWETDVRFVDCDSFGGVVCPRCFFHAPPHFEYLRGLFRPTFSHELTYRIATFAYDWCASHEEAVSRAAASQEEDDVIICPMCNPEWLGWYCKFCSRTSGL